MARGLTQQIERVQVFTLDGGMDDRNPPWILDERHAELIQNMEIDRPGQRRRRSGAATIASASGVTTTISPNGIWEFTSNDLSQLVLMGVWDGNLFQLPGNGQLLAHAVGVSLTSALHMASEGRWSFGGDNRQAIYISNAQLDDTTPASATDLIGFAANDDFSQTTSMAPLCTTWWQGRLWCGANKVLADGVSTDDALWWSALQNGMSYSLTNTVTIEPGRGGRITALHPIRALSPRLIVWKERLIAVFDVRWGSSSAFIPGAADALDTINSSIFVVNNSAGCVATKSVQSTPGNKFGDFFFLSHDGVRTLSRAAGDEVSGSALPVSAVIQGTIDRINFAFAHLAVSTVHEQRYYLAVPLDGATENTHILSFDFITSAWTIHTWQGKDLATSRLTQTADRLWLQSNIFTTDTTPSTVQSGYHTYRLFSGDIDPGGDPVPYQEDGRAFTFGSLHVRKKFTWFSIHADNPNATTEVDVFVKVDNDSYVLQDTVIFPTANVDIVILAATPLPWTSIPNGVKMRKIGLEDVPPGHMIQFRLGQTSVSDFGRVNFLQTAAAARIIDEEFSNEIT